MEAKTIDPVSDSLSLGLLAKKKLHASNFPDNVARPKSVVNSVYDYAYKGVLWILKIRTIFSLYHPKLSATAKVKK